MAFLPYLKLNQPVSWPAGRRHPAGFRALPPDIPAASVEPSDPRHVSAESTVSR